MVTPKSDAERRMQSAERLLLEYFLVSGPSWPGGDSVTTEDVLAGYVAAMGKAMVPSSDDLAQRHPELAGEFRILLQAHVTG